MDLRTAHQSKCLEVEPREEKCLKILSLVVTLRNCPEILEVADFYSASQLKTACFDFLHLNAAAMIEGRQLEGLSDRLMDELTAYYRRQTPRMAHRSLAISTPSPTPEDLALLDSLLCSPNEPEADSGEPLACPEDGPVSLAAPPTSSRRRKRRQFARRMSASSDEMASPRAEPTEGTETQWDLAPEEFPSLEGEEEEEVEEEEEEGPAESR